MIKHPYDSVDAYIAGFPEEIQKLLLQIRETIKEAAPEANEAIKYGLPTWILKGNLVHFGAFKNHIGFYPAPSGINAFEKELSMYKQGKGSIHFPLDHPIPLDLIKKIVAFRVKQNVEKAEKRAKK